MSKEAFPLIKKNYKYIVTGLLAGIPNGFFGAGGGMILVPLFCRWLELPEKKAFATCVAVIFPLCVVSAVVYFLRCALPLAQALPYLVGGAAGGLVGGRLFQNVPNVWLRRIFAVFLLYGAWRYLS